MMPRHVKPETVHIGDTIKVESKALDATRIVIGTVAERDYQGSDRVLLTALGVELIRYNPGITMTNKPVVTLLQGAPTRDQPSLFEMDIIA